MGYTCPHSGHLTLPDKPGVDKVLEVLQVKHEATREDGDWTDVSDEAAEAPDFGNDVKAALAWLESSRPNVKSVNFWGGGKYYHDGMKEFCDALVSVGATFQIECGPSEDDGFWMFRSRNGKTEEYSGHVRWYDSEGRDVTDEEAT